VGKHKIRVTAICPGVIDTSRMDDLGRGDLWQGLVKQAIPLGRAGTGLDIATIVVFLCSDQGAWITGQSYNVDGGHVVAH
jgi:NAD(P)-dependent dehydrogenase (short-subunit alcohol dehydrogenase family)